MTLNKYAALSRETLGGKLLKALEITVLSD